MNTELPDKKEKLPSTGEKKMNRIYQLIAVVFFISAAILGWQFLDQKAITEAERSEKDQVKEQLTSLLKEYEAVTSDNAEMEKQLREKESELKEMLGDLEKLEKANLNQKWLIGKYKKESKTLRRLLKVYLHEIDSLGKTIIVLEEEKTIVEGELTKEIERTTNLTEEKDQLSEKVNLGSKFKLYNLLITGVRARSGGKEREESRARKVEKIKACFTIGANDLATAGERDFFIRVANDKGIVFPKGEDSTNVFIANGKELAYSGKRTLNYQSKPVDICIYFQKFLFDPGNYTIDIFADGTQIGESSIMLE